jgi:hypothetical protein
LHRNKFKVNVDNLLKSLITSLTAYSITYPGWVKDVIDNWVGKNVTGANLRETKETLTSGDITGSFTNITNEFKAVTINISGVSANRIDNLIGTLANIILNNATTSLTVSYSGITGGLSTFNVNIGTLDLSNNRFNQSAVDNDLVVIDNFFIGGVVPIKNLLHNISGATMAAPSSTGIAAKNSIIAKYAARGLTATISHN